MKKKPVVLLLAYGGPESLDEIEPFLQRLLRQDKIPPQMLQRVKEKYQQIGAGSPLPRICRSIRRKLAAVFIEQGFDLPVYLAYRYANPGIFSVVEMLREIDVGQTLAVSLSPHTSTISTKAYFTTLETALAGYPMKIVPITKWFRHPLYIDCLVRRIEKTAEKNGFRLNDSTTALIFSAHNIPQSFLDKGDPYLEEIKENIALVTARLPTTTHYLAYQSKGNAPGPWLEPDVEDLLFQLIRSGQHRNFLLIPISFAMDHLETLYDLDLKLMPKIRKKVGIKIDRIGMPNDEDDFVNLLASVIKNTHDLAG